jgi:EmrB/QacA subfamily drug resistance transporter
MSSTVAAEPAGRPTAPSTSRASASVPARHRVPPARVLAVAAAGAGLAFVDATIVNVAFPDIQGEFSATTLGTLSWILNAYNIVFAALLVAAGRFADLLGRRRMFHAGILIFTLASLACAAAPSAGALIAARALQAIGAAIVVPASLALVLEAYPPRERAHGVALWSAAAALAAGLGPSLGGVLVEAGGWRLAFLVNLPLGAAALIAGRRTLVESRAPGRRTMPDLTGAALAAVAIAAVTLGIVQGEAWGWTSPAVLGAFATGAGLVALVVRRCTWHRSPVLDLNLLRIRSLSVANALTVVGAAGFYAYVLNNVLFLTGVWHYSVLEAGLALSPGPFVAAAIARPASRIAARVGYRPMLVVGGLVWAGALAGVRARVGTEPAFLSQWLPAMVALGIGAGLTFPLLSAAGVASAPGERFATATALNSVSRQLGAVLGVALLVVVVGTPGPTEAAAAFDRGWAFAAACLAVIAAGATALGRVRPVDATDAPAAAPPAPPRVPDADEAAALTAPADPSPGRVPAWSALAIVPLQGGLPVDELVDALRRTLPGVAVVRRGDGAPERLPSGRTLLVADRPGDRWTDTCLLAADHALCVTGGGPVPLDLYARPELRGSDVVLVEGAPGARGFGLWLDVLAARAGHVVRVDDMASGAARVVRRLTGRAVGLVLSGGGARGLAHVGVVEELLAAGVPIDRVGGTSMGAFVGAMLALGMDPEEIDARCYEEWVRRSPLSDYRVPRVSLIRGDKARAMLDRTFGTTRIEAAVRAFCCVSCDLISGELVVHRRGPLVDAVGASISVPGIVPPLARDGRLLVDGGVLDNLPVAAVGAGDEGPLIAVDMTARVRPGRPGDEPLSLRETLVRTLTLGSADTSAAAQRDADLVIEPADIGSGFLEFHQLDRLRDEGRRAALDALARAPAAIFG